MMGLPDGRKSYSFSFDSIPAVTDSQRANQTRCRSKDTTYYIVWVKIDVGYGAIYQI